LGLPLRLGSSTGSGTALIRQKKRVRLSATKKKKTSPFPEFPLDGNSEGCKDVRGLLRGTGVETTKVAKNEYKFRFGLGKDFKRRRTTHIAQQNKGSLHEKGEGRIDYLLKCRKGRTKGWAKDTTIQERRKKITVTQKGAGGPPASISERRKTNKRHEKDQNADARSRRRGFLQKNLAHAGQPEGGSR